MNKKNLHRFLSVILSLILVLSVTLSVFAENEFAAEDTDAAEQQEFFIEPLEDQEDAGDFYLEEAAAEEEDTQDGAKEDGDLFEEEPAAEPETVPDQSETEIIEPSEELFPAADADEELLLTDGEEVLEQNSVVPADTDYYVYDSGKCGSKAKWECVYDRDSDDWIIRITGSGAISHYDDADNCAPWRYYGVDKIIIGKDITSIGRYAFTGKQSVESVVFEGTNVTQICKYAFSNCYNLTSITIPKGVETIQSYAFYGCNSLKTVSLPSTLTTIGTNAFYYCDSLVKIQIPTSVTSIGKNALYGCKDVYFGKTASVWESIGGKQAVTSDAVLHTVKSLSKAVVTLSRTSYNYTGKAIKPAVTVKLGSKTLKRSTDYQLSFKNNKSVGTATVTIKGIYGYSGSVQTTFNIYRRSIAGATVSGLKDRAYTGKIHQALPDSKSHHRFEYTETGKR